MRKILLRLHLVLALAASALLLVLGSTGAVMAFEEPLHVLFHPSWHHIAPAEGPRLPIAAVVRVVAQRYPGETIAAVYFPNAPGRSTTVRTARRVVFVNAYSGEILGAEDGLDVLAFIHQVHLRLVPGLRSPAVTTALGMASISLFALVLSGYALWWRQRRVTMSGGAGAFRRSFDLHQVGGFWSGLFLLVSSATGAALAWDAPLLARLLAASGGAPPARTAPSKPRPGSAITPERAIEIAAAALPDAAPIGISWPRADTDSYDVRMHFPEDRTPGGRSWVSVDRYGGEVLLLHSARTAPAAIRGMTLVRGLHTGDVFGTPSRILFSLSSLLLVLQTVTGLVMWRARPRARAEGIRMRKTA